MGTPGWFEDEDEERSTEGCLEELLALAVSFGGGAGGG